MQRKDYLNKKVEYNAVLRTKHMQSHTIKSSKYYTCGLIVVDTNPVQLQVTVSMVGPRGIDAMLIADDFPELQMEGISCHIYALTTQLMRLEVLSEKAEGLHFFFFDGNGKIFPLYRKP